MSTNDVETKENRNESRNGAQFCNARYVWNESHSIPKNELDKDNKRSSKGYKKVRWKDLDGPSSTDIVNNMQIEIENTNSFQFEPGEYHETTIALPSILMNNMEKVRRNNNYIGNNEDTQNHLRNPQINNITDKQVKHEINDDHNGGTNEHKEELDENEDTDIEMKVDNQYQQINPFNDIVDIMCQLIKAQTKSEFVMSNLNGRITTLTENLHISQSIMENVEFFNKYNCM